MSPGSEPPQCRPRSAWQSISLWLVVWLVVVASQSACAPALDWREVRVPEGAGLVALFPCKPEHRQRTVNLPGVAGGPVALHLLSCQADGATWALSYAHAGTVERRLSALPALRQALWANVQPGPKGPTPTSPPGSLSPLNVPGSTPHPSAGQGWMQGWRPVSATQTEPVSVRTWYFSKGLHVFQASLMQTALQPDDPRAHTFGAGFNFPR